MGSSLLFLSSLLLSLSALHVLLVQGQIPSCSSTASAVVVPTPWWSLNFATDPRTQAVTGGAAGAAYGWQAYDPTDATPNQAIHTGIIQLYGGPGSVAAGSYLNLSASSGPNSIGSVFPGMMGGSGAGVASMGTAGWSFELVFKEAAQSTWAKLFDFGNPFFVSGQCYYDLLFGWDGSTYTWTFTDCDAVGIQQTIYSTYTSSPGIWYHVIISIQQMLDSNGSPSQFATYTMYINGTTQLGNGAGGPLPPAVPRGNGFIGKSDWGDAYFNGSLDTFNIYNYALNPAQANALYLNKMGSSCSITTGVPTGSPVITPSTAAAPAPTPYWSLPTSQPSISSPNYGWLTSDPADASCGLSSYHQGLYTLAGAAGTAAGQFLNLSTATGPNSVGTVLPTIGGPSAGSLTTGTAGWSFEFMVKPTLIETWAKLFDFGQPQVVAGTCSADVLAGWWGGGPMWTFTTCSTTAQQYSIYNALGNPVTLNQWVHGVMVIQQNADGTANYYTYLNGHIQGAFSEAGYPQAVSRPNADIGRSDWGDAYWAGYIDFFNVYNYAVSGPQVLALYNGATNGGTIPASCPPYQPVPACDPVASTVVVPTPWWSLNFATDPRTQAVTGGAAGAAYGWQAYDPTDATPNQAIHTGIIQLYGGPGSVAAGSYLNLSASSGPNSIGSVFPGMMGGSGAGVASMGTAGWSFELVFKEAAQSTWAKLFDFGNPFFVSGQCYYDLLFGWDGSTYTWTFTDCDAVGIQQTIYSTYTSSPGIWYHVIISIQQMLDSNGSPSQFATYTMYINGTTQLGNGAGGPLPPAVPRGNGFIGKSDWGDAYFNGSLDTFNIYNYALNPAQANALYLNKMGSSCSITTGVPTGSPVITPSTAAAPAPTPYWSLPTSQPSISSPNYGWLTSDPADASCGLSSYHQGLYTLAGAAGTAAGQFLNLSTATGPNSVGTVLPTIGGPSAGSLTTGTAGWSFEFMVKPTLIETWAKLFDFGQPQVVAGTCSADVLAGWWGGGPMWTFTTCSTTAQQYSIYNALGNPVTLNQWVHGVMVIQQNADGTANYYTYLNGHIQGAFSEAGYPQAVSRPNADIGRSDWGDAYWAGYIDFFNVYNYALSGPQVLSLYNGATNGGTIPFICPPYQAIPSCSSTASAIAIPTPWFSLTFATDPRTSSVTGGASGADYGWNNTDIADSTANQAIHQGFVTLGGGGGGGAYGPYINLSAASGPNSVGKTLPQYIGGQGAGTVATGTAGWTFEIVFKQTSQQTWAKLFDIGNPQVNGQCRDDLLFGWNSNTMQWTFTYCDGGGFGYTITSPYASVLGVWYHVVITIQTLMDTSGQASSAALYYMYINGTGGLGQGSGGPLPTAVYRANADLGRSDWYDNYWNGEIDTFNIYNYALSQPQANALYLNKMGSGCSITTGSPASNPPTAPGTSTATPPAPLWALPTSSAPAVSGANYGWVQQDSADTSCGINQYHQGLITLAGTNFGTPGVVGQWINVSAATGPASVNSVMPTVGGASAGTVAAGTAGWTFEYMVKPTYVDTWAKLFDFGQPQTSDGACHYDIISGWFDNGPYWSFSTCDPNNIQYAINNAFGNVNLNQWIHAVLVIQLNADGTSSYFSYGNGRLLSAFGWAYYPAAVPRPNGLIGRSDWASDFQWSGEIDFFNVYNYAISGPQALSLYNSATGNGGAAAACTPSSTTAPSTIPSSSKILDLNFTTDPRGATGGSPNYGWTNVDSTDSASQQALHQGLLTLAGAAAGTAGQYVNLTSATGPLSVGVAMSPTALGGASSGDVPSGTAGFTIEVIFKAQGPQTWAKLLDFGNPQVGGVCRDDILFGQFSNVPTQMTFQTCDQTGAQWGMDPIPNFNGPVQGVWNHAVLVIQQGASGQGNYYAYFNGSLVSTILTSYYPEPLPRTNAAIGKSGWNDNYWQGEIDSIRIWNYAATATQANNLWLVSQGQSPNSPNGQSNSGGGSSGLSNGAIAGIVIGSVVGALILLCICAFFLCGAGRSQKKGSSSTEASRRGSGQFDEMEASRNQVELSNVPARTGGEEHTA